MKEKERKKKFKSQPLPPPAIKILSFFQPSPLPDY